MMLAALERVTCAYSSEPVLESIDLVIPDGAYLGIVGPSGSGKTTLLRTIMGTVAPVAGTVRRAPGLRIGYVPQVETVDWNFPVTVSDVVGMSRISGRIWPWPSRAEREEIEAVLGRLGIAHLGRRHIRELSGGQQQRVFVARALVGRPHLLLLDEPTSGVDVRTRHDMLHLLADLNASGLAIALTTHDLNGVAAHLPEIVCLNVKVIARGTPAGVVTPEILERTYGARLEVLEHGGMRVVVEPNGVHDASHGGSVVQFPKGEG